VKVWHIHLTVIIVMSSNPTKITMNTYFIILYNIKPIFYSWLSHAERRHLAFSHSKEGLRLFPLLLNLSQSFTAE